MFRSPYLLNLGGLLVLSFAVGCDHTGPPEGEGAFPPEAQERVERARIRDKLVKTRNTLIQVVTGIEMASDPCNLGEYPPSSVAELRVGRKRIGQDIGVRNEINMGIESVAIVLYMSALDGEEDLKLSTLINTDKDIARRNLTKHAGADLFEICDAWGHPLVYIHHRDYERLSVRGSKIQLADGTILRAKPRRCATAGTYHNPDSYQIFSIGPDGVPNTEDDVGNF